MEEDLVVLIIEEWYKKYHLLIYENINCPSNYVDFRHDMV